MYRPFNSQNTYDNDNNKGEYQRKKAIIDIHLGELLRMFTQDDIFKYTAVAKTKGRYTN